MKGRAWKLISLATVLSAGCSSSGSSSRGGGTTLDDVPAEYAGALCDAYRACVGPLIDVFLPGEDCETVNTARIKDSFGSIEQAVEDGRVVYDSTHIQACIQDIRSRTCSELLDRETPECEAALEGTVALGDDCTVSAECEGTAYCKFGNSCPGVCSVLEAEGNACVANDQCRSGLNCSNVSQVCEAPAGAGDVCGGMTDPECEPGLFCAGANEDNNTPGNCRTIDEVLSVGLGEPCDIVASELCEAELVCEIQSIDMTGIVSECAEKVGSGRPCRLAAPDQCPADEYCNATLMNLEGSCTPKPVAGEPCAQSPFSTDAEDMFCAPETRCDGGTCRPLAQLGGSCTADAVCLSERCEGGRCVTNSACEE